MLIYNLYIRNLVTVILINHLLYKCTVRCTVHTYPSTCMLNQTTCMHGSLVDDMHGANMTHCDSTLHVQSVQQCLANTKLRQYTIIVFIVYIKVCLYPD